MNNMKAFGDFSKQYAKEYQTYCLKEWYSAFVIALNSMCNEMTKRARSGFYVNPAELTVCLKAVFDDNKHEITFNEQTQMFIFPVGALPQISSETISILELMLKDQFESYGWTHYEVHSRIDRDSISVWTSIKS